LQTGRDGNQQRRAGIWRSISRELAYHEQSERLHPNPIPEPQTVSKSGPQELASVSCPSISKDKETLDS